MSMSLSSAAADPAIIHCGSCQDCPVHACCVSRNLSGERLRKFESIRAPLIVRRRNEYLYQAGAGQAALYIVRSGTLKTVIATAEGDEQITGFYLPGDTIGFDALASGNHPGSAAVLQTSSICALPLTELSQLCAELPELQEQIWRLMSREVMARQELQLAMAQRDAEARLVIFLLSLSARMQQLGYSANDFQLPMTRYEIGNYLGLSMETVSRLFTHLHHDGLISRYKRFVKLTDPQQLKQRCARTARYRALNAVN